MPRAKPQLKKETFWVYKSGIPFYDVARLIGVAHLFFGTASAEMEDKGAYWEVKGIQVNRDKEQLMWVLERGKGISAQLKQKNAELKKAFDQLSKFHKEFNGLPITGRGRGSYPSALAELDSAIVRGTRGIDPLANPHVLSQAGKQTNVPTEKKFNMNWSDFLAASIGFSFAANTSSRGGRAYILPVFRERFILSGFLEFKRHFYHVAGEAVAKVYAAISILLDLINKRLSVVDFVHTSIKGRNISFSSGYLGLEKLCGIWWEAVQKNDEGVLNLLSDIRYFLNQTHGSKTHEQVQHLTRWVADFVANPNVDTLTRIEHLKARILAASQNRNVEGTYAANRLLNRKELVKEVGRMMQINLPEVPWQVSEALAKALGFDVKGWMNQFTRLENATNFAQFIQQLEHIISRGYYREQQERGQQSNIREALTHARDLANKLREMSGLLQDEKSFRAWKAIFLLDVLSRARVRVEQPQEQTSASEVMREPNEMQQSLEEV